MNKTGIEYLTHTWNPMHGCSPISPGCKNCWAASMAKRLAGMGASGYDPSNPFKVTLHLDRLAEPLALKTPARIGVSFMGDLFHDDVPFTYILKTWQVMAAAAANDHVFMVLTKRPERMKDFFEWWEFSEPLANVWLGVTVENQEQADKRIPLLLQTPAAKRFVSVEPMLGKVDLKPYFPGGKSTWWECICGTKAMPLTDDTECLCNDLYDQEWWFKSLDWVVCGGESGPDSRPCHPEWVRDLRDQCKAAKVPFMFKQWGEYRPHREFLKPYVIVDFQGNVYQPGQVPENNHGQLRAMMKVGKKAAGRLIDEYELHMEMPA